MNKLTSMKLEHYPAMTQKMLKEIETEAYKRWKIIDSVIVHRFGLLKPGDQIVLVATLSSHRIDAIESCHFLIDWLKTKGPFWKYEETRDGGSWVDAKLSDDMAAEKW